MDFEAIKNLIFRGENTDSDGNLYDKDDLYSRQSTSSTAKGKYQLLSFWNGDIEKFAKDNGYEYDGVQSYLNNSILQEDHYDHVLKNYATPEINTLKNKGLTRGLTDSQLYAAWHKVGYNGLKKALENKSFDDVIYDISINEYLKRAGLEKVTFEQPKEEPNTYTPALNYARVDSTYVAPPTKNVLPEQRKLVPIMLQQPKPQDTEFAQQLLADVLNFKPVSGITLYQDGGIKKTPLSLEKDISVQGYKDNSPYKNEPQLNIHSNSGKITMNNVSTPLLVESNLGEKRLLQPNSGTHQFTGTDFKETPIKPISTRIPLSL